MSAGGEGQSGRDALLEREPRCPKHMVFGPCGGVRPGGLCEAGDRPCPFIAGGPEVTADLCRGPVDGAGDWLLDRRRRGPIVVCDARPTEPTLAAASALGAQHEGWCDAVLLGEHHDAVDLPNALVASAVLDAGARPWVTLACRDRNAVALEAELVACRELGVTEVHCVTGDLRAPHVRPGTTPVFDLDAVRLTAMACSFGLVASVAESPHVEPVELRPARAASKSRAGASWCFVNLGVTPEGLERFVRRAGEEGSTMKVIACVPVFTDEEGAKRLSRLPGVVLDEAEVDAVLRAPSPVEAGIERAVAQARHFLAVDGVEGVDLSGPAATTSPAERVRVMREVAQRLDEVGAVAG